VGEEPPRFAPEESLARLPVREHLVAAGVARRDDRRELRELGAEDGGGADGIMRHDARLHALAGGAGGELREERGEAAGEGDLGELRVEEEARDAAPAERGHLHVGDLKRARNQVRAAARTLDAEGLERSMAHRYATAE